MAFRADEQAQADYDEIENYFLNPKLFTVEQRKIGLARLKGVTRTLGPVVSSYPSWHPLVENGGPSLTPLVYPNYENGYEGLDHTRCFVHGFITCPYGSPDRVLESVEKLRRKEADVTARVLDFKLYSPDAFPVLVECKLPTESDMTISIRTALSLLLRNELRDSELYQLAETWATLRPYFLGAPHGAASSHFINLKNGRTIKKLWNCLIETGIYGPIRY